MNSTLRTVLVAVTALAGSGVAVADVYSRPGRYQLDAEGWALQPGANSSLILRCEDCVSPVQVQIDYSDERSGPGTEGGNPAFLDALASEEAQQQFAELMVEASLPEEVAAADVVDITVAKVGKTEFGGLPMFRYVALIDGGGDVVTQESSLVAIHHNRIVKIALNHYHEALDDAARARIASLFVSFRFDPEIPSR